jgi:hypothetical protein
VIPRHSLGLRTDVPGNWAYWTPKRADLTEEGFGFFRDTWLIRGVTVAEAREALRYEAEILVAIDHSSRDSAAFDAICRAVESADPEQLPPGMTADQRGAIEPFLAADPPPSGGLELGVAGLVYALANVGCWPAASCRGHPGRHAWAPHPVVYVALDRHRASVLLPLLDEASCGITVDDARGDLLAVVGESVENTVALGQLVFGSRTHFKPPPSTVRRRHRPAGEQQAFEL